MNKRVNEETQTTLSFLISRSWRVRKSQEMINTEIMKSLSAYSYSEYVADNEMSFKTSGSYEESTHDRNIRYIISWQ